MLGGGANNAPQVTDRELRRLLVINQVIRGKDQDADLGT